MPKESKWYSVLSPKEFGLIEIGEVMAPKPEHLLNHRLAIDVTTLTGDASRYYMKLIFRIVGCEGEKAHTVFDSFEVFRDYITHMIAKHSRRVDVVQDVNSKDGNKLRVKSVCVLAGRAKGSVCKRARKLICSTIEQEAKRLKVDEFVKATIAGEIKDKIVRQVNSVYPVKDFEIRKIELKE